MNDFVGKKKKGYTEDIGFHEQRDGSLARLSVEGERKSCEPRNIRRNTFGIVLEGDVVKRSANNASERARERERALCGPRHRIALSLSLSLPSLHPHSTASNSKGHQRKSWKRPVFRAAIWFRAKSRGFPNDNVYQQLRAANRSARGGTNWFRANCFR